MFLRRLRFLANETYSDGFPLPVPSVPSCLLAQGRFWTLRIPSRKSAANGAQLTCSVYIRYEYLWEDGVRYKRPTKLPAPDYVDALMNWAQGLLDNDEIFPNKIGGAR